MEMELTKVESSNIAAIGYDREQQTLLVEFKSGDVYSYAQVPAEVHEQFMQAESKGRFFRLNIRGRYEHAKVDRASAALVKGGAQ